MLWALWLWWWWLNDDDDNNGDNNSNINNGGDDDNGEGKVNVYGNNNIYDDSYIKRL